MTNDPEIGSSRRVNSPLHNGHSAISATAPGRLSPEQSAQALEGVSAEGIILMDDTGTVVSFNAAAERMFGYRADEIIGRNVNVLIASPDREKQDEYLNGYSRTDLATSPGVVRDLMGLRKNGDAFLFHLRISEFQSEGRRFFAGFLNEYKQPRQTEGPQQDDGNLLSTILNTVATLIVVIDADGHIVRFNRACEEITGYRFEEVRGRCIWDFLLDPEESLGVQMVFRRLLEAAMPNDYENHWIAKDGTARRIAWRNTVLVDPEGLVTHIIGTGVDVTDRRIAEAAQQELTRRFIATFENAAVGIAHVSTDGRWLRVNGKLCEITGYSREELLNRTFGDITYPADVEADWRAVPRLLRREIKSYSTEKRYLHKRGLIIWVALTVSLVCSESGDPAYFISVIQDITMKKQAELALRDSEDHLRRVLDSMYIFVGVLSPAGTLLHASRAPLEAAGVTWEQVSLRKFWECYWWTHSVPAQRKLMKVIEKARTGVSSRYDEEIRIAGDQRMTVDFMLSPMRNDEGRITHLIASAVDITTRKQLEREVLEISEREQRRIGQDLHDDLCQRLTATEFLAHSLARDLANDSPIYANRVEKIAGYIRGSISHTRLLSRGLSPVTLSEGGLVTALSELSSSTEEMFNVSCWLDFAPDIAITDQEIGAQLYRIAQEAISNAVRHGHATHIDITVGPFEDLLRLTIADNGVGIAHSQRSKDGMGLRIMGHRAGIINATLEIRPGHGAGTEVVCTFPR